MDLELTDRVGLVGGASRGLGRATAELFAEEGMRLGIYARGPAIETAAQEISDTHGVPVHPIRADVRVAADCRRVVEETVEAFGGLDVLVTNMASDVHALELPDTNEEWEEEWQLYIQERLQAAITA